MGNEISIQGKSTANNMFIPHTTNSDKPLKFNTYLANNLFNSDNIHPHETAVNLKRACCVKNPNTNESVIALPLLNKDKTYSTIKIKRTGLTESACTIDGAIYGPSTDIQQNIPCETFYSSFCDHIFDKRVKDGFKNGEKNYMQQNNLNWFSDCNCINSPLQNRKTEIKKNDVNGFGSLPDAQRLPSVFDKFCKNDPITQPVNPFQTKGDLINGKKSLTICSQSININADTIAGAGNFNNISFDNNCGQSDSKEKKPANNATEPINHASKPIDSSTKPPSNNNVDNSTMYIVIGAILFFFIIIIIIIIMTRNNNNNNNLMNYQ